MEMAEIIKKIKYWEWLYGTFFASKEGARSEFWYNWNSFVISQGRPRLSSAYGTVLVIEQRWDI